MIYICTNLVLDYHNSRKYVLACPPFSLGVADSIYVGVAPWTLSQNIECFDVVYRIQLLFFLIVIRKMLQNFQLKQDRALQIDPCP